jgi:hypothetical protein
VGRAVRPEELQQVIAGYELTSTTAQEEQQREQHVRVGRDLVVADFDYALP